MAHALTWRYVTALILVALVTTATWFSLQLVIAKQKDTAAIVNISGRQRMLSQRTALFSQLLIDATVAEQPRIRSKLKESIELMARSHFGLIYGDDALGLPARMSPTIHAMYFQGKNPLNTQVEIYIKAVQTLLATNPDKLTATDPSLTYIINVAPTTLVTSLDKMVRQYQLEGEASIKLLQRTETILWLVTLLLLLLEAILIFNPFAKYIKAVIDRLQRTKNVLKAHEESLETKIEQRTAELASRSKELAESEKRLSVLLDNTNIHMWAFDGTSYTYTNKQWFEFTGQNPSDLLTIERWSSVLHPDDLEEATKIWLEHWETKTEHDNYFRLKRHDGVYRDFYCHTTPILDEYGAFQYIQGYNLDITERNKLENEVRQLAFYDALTKLPNRRLLNDRISRAMTTSKRSRNYGALMFLDLDNFKPLNDTHGHVVGDLLLIEAARRLESCMREMDTVARFGGDEFVVMLGELDADKSAAKIQAHFVAEKIRSTLSEPYVLRVSNGGNSSLIVEHHCTASIGVVLFINHESSQDDIMKWADDAMYQAKEAGRNQIKFYSEEN